MPQGPLAGDGGGSGGNFIPITSTTSGWDGDGSQPAVGDVLITCLSLLAATALSLAVRWALELQTRGVLDLISRKGYDWVMPLVQVSSTSRHDPIALGSRRERVQQL
jgi:hypothetical protein